MVIVLMGVSGAGKTTVGQLLARCLGADYAEGDSFHPPANVAKMARGEPLDDADRMPWLETIASTIDTWLAEDRRVVVSCSALKRRYREILAGGRSGVVFVHLHGPKALIAERLTGRSGHFMPPALLDSQFQALEVPEDAVTVDIHPPPEAIVEVICERLERLAPRTQGDRP